MLILVIAIVLLILFYFDTRSAALGGEQETYKIINERLTNLPNYPLSRYKIQPLYREKSGKTILYPDILLKQQKMITEPNKVLDISINFYKFMLDNPTQENINNLMGLRVYTSDFFTVINNTTRILDINEVNIFNTISYEEIFKNISQVISLSKFKASAGKNLLGPDWEQKLANIEKYNYAVNNLNTFKDYKTNKDLLLKRESNVTADNKFDILFSEATIDRYCSENNAIRVVMDMISLYRKYYDWSIKNYKSSDHYPSLALNRIDKGNIALWCKKEAPIKNFTSVSYNALGADGFKGDTMSIIVTPPGLRTLVISPLSTYPEESEILLPFVTIGRWLNVEAKSIYAIDTSETGVPVSDKNNITDIPLKELSFYRESSNPKIAFVTYFMHPNYQRTTKYIGYINEVYNQAADVKGGGSVETINAFALELMRIKYGSFNTPIALRELRNLNIDEALLTQLENDILRNTTLKAKTGVKKTYRNR